MASLKRGALTKMDHFYQNVRGWFAFEDLYREVAQNLKNDMLLVEVGSWHGKSAAFMAVEIANSGKTGIEFVCIDPWREGGPDLVGTEFESKGDELYDSFLRNLAPVANVVKPLRQTSLEAVALFDDESIDFLMLDGDHNYPNVRDEIQAYLPKMKKGGIIAGDDFMWPGVEQSVNETIGVNHCGVRHVRRHRNYKLSASYWFYRVK